MPNPSRLAPIAMLLAIGFSEAHARPGDSLPETLRDPRLNDLRRASVAWDNRLGPARTVVDQVALVPDVPTFLKTLREWDGETWFPILIEDERTSPTFLRAFLPKRLLRRGSRGHVAGPEPLWNLAQEAVERARKAVPADVPTPPGLILSTPDSPSLAGAAALAAGRFQPLVRWDMRLTRADRLDEDQARALASDLELLVSRQAPQFGRLGDECDFLTLAGDYPDRYSAEKPGILGGIAAFDDLIGRDMISSRRWAFAGRLDGDPAESVYRAMCSLFLPTKSAILFDTYDPGQDAFRPYIMKDSRENVPDGIVADLRDGGRASLEGWHAAFSPLNRLDLVYVNSRGGPTTFGLDEGSEGIAADVPPSEPAVVLMNHSFAAANPLDPNTLAGAWLQGGAFLFYGSLNEPYIQSFRSPKLVLALLRDGLPIAAAVRMLPDENPVFGGPWRLHLLGDPLYRVAPLTRLGTRRPPAAPSPGWIVLDDEPHPLRGTSDEEVLRWATTATLLASSRGGEEGESERTLQGLDRDRLDEDGRHRLDALVADALARSPNETLRDRVARIPRGERTTFVSQRLDWVLGARLQADLTGRDWPKIAASWDRLLEGASSGQLRDEATVRVGRYAERNGRVEAWKAQLRVALSRVEADSDATRLRRELRRISSLGGLDR